MAVPLTLSSVPAQTPYVQYVSGSGQTVFPYPFEITQDADLIVLINGVQQATDSGYTLSGQGATGGGNVTFTLGQTAGAIITLYRNISIARITQLAQNGTFFSANFNNEYNRIYLIMQQLEQSIGFCLQIPNTNIGAPVTTLLPSAYANKGLSFDVNGNPQPFALTSSALTQATFDSFLSSVTFTGASGDGYSDANFVRTANYSGGTAGHVATCMTVETDVTGAGVANYEWAFLSILNNSATAGQNVAGYFQGNRVTTGAGPTWGGVFEVRDKGGAANPSVGLVGLEVDCRATGTDTSTNRVGVDVVISRYPINTGTAMTASYGVRVQNGGDNSATVTNCFTVDASSFGSGLAFLSGSSGIWGINTASATLSSGFACVAQGQSIVWDGPSTLLTQTAYDGVGFFLEYNSVKQIRLNINGTISTNLSGTMTQVVGAQQTTGVAAATFLQVDTTTAVSTDSTFDGYTLKQVVKALRIHGLLA